MPARDAVAQIYLVGLIASAMALHDCAVRFDLTQPWLLWLGTIFVAAYALATSYLWSCRQGLANVAAALGIPPRTDAQLAGLVWLVPANLSLVAAVVGMTFLIELTDKEVPRRLLAAQAALTQVASVALLRAATAEVCCSRSALQLGAAGAVLYAFAFLEVGSTLTLLHALVALSAALALVAVIYGFGLGKLLRESSDWLAPRDS